MTTITPFLWFDDHAEQAIARYSEVFDDTEILDENHHPDGSLFLATIRLQGTELTLMNGGPHCRLTDAFSLSVGVETQEEVDAISDALVDAFGLSWQVVPSLLGRLLADPDRGRADRVQQAMLQMKRLDLQGLQDAYDG
jgi:predicted 3-demethylubiquinone-9 3-methyltransferase (glyoxalase superfamily)